MKKSVLCALLLLVLGLFCTPVWAGGWVRLEIKGTNVNLRTIPDTSGDVLAQANTGDVFIAEEWPILNEEANSNWYKLIWAVDKESGAIVDLPQFDRRLDQGVLTFVNEQVAQIKPLNDGEEEHLIKRPYGKSADPGLEDNLPALVRTFGEGEIQRTFNANDSENFDIAFYSIVELPGLRAVIAESSDQLDEKKIHSFTFFNTTLSKPGVAIYEFDPKETVVVGQSKKEDVEKIFNVWVNNGRTVDKDTSEDGNETWMIVFEMNGVNVTFDKNGILTKYDRWVSIH